MIKCFDGSVLPMDERVIKYVATSPAFRLTLDPDYVAALPLLHGGVPVAPFFATQKGEKRQVAPAQDWWALKDFWKIASGGLYDS